MATRIPVGFGTATLGPPGSTGGTVATLEDAQAMIDLYLQYGNVIDTANIYTDGHAEQMLSKLNLGNATVDSKIIHLDSGHQPAKVRAAVKKTVQTLAPHKIRAIFLHFPDHTTPYEDTIQELNELHKEGDFQELGLSNYASWEVAEIYNVCKLKGWVLPTVYQGRYNAIERGPELELFPMLKKYGIKFYAFSPLAASLLTGRFPSEEEFNNPGSHSRFDPKGPSIVAAMWRGIAAPLLPIVRDLNNKIVAHGITLVEASLRWLQHHSALDPEKDLVLLGASRISQLENSLKACAGGPLPDDVVQAFEEAWSKAKSVATPYFF